MYSRLSRYLIPLTIIGDVFLFQDQAEAISTLQNVQNSCRERTGQISGSAIYPVAGALLGTCLGGPVGLLAGVKIGGLAAIGGSMFGM